MSNNRFKSFDSLATAVQSGTVAVDAAGEVAAQVGGLLRKIEAAASDFNVDSMSDAELSDRIALARKRLSESTREQREQRLARMSHAARKARWRDEELPASDESTPTRIGRGYRKEPGTPITFLPVSCRPEDYPSAQYVFGLFDSKSLTCIKFEVIRAWSSEFRRLVETDNVRITRWKGGWKSKAGLTPEDVEWYASREWAREHYKAMRANGYVKMF